MNYKEAKATREATYNVLENVDFAEAGLEYLGRVSEGNLYAKGGDFVVVRTIVKADTFDAEAALEEYKAKEIAAKEKAAKKAKKASKDKAKRKAKVEDKIASTIDKIEKMKEKDAE